MPAEPDGLIQIPGGQWAIAADTNLTPSALRSGSIIIEGWLCDLPEVRKLEAGSIVVDVGAFIGDTALIFLNRGCEVWAIEPYPDAFECMRRNCGDAHLLNVAAGDGRGYSLSETHEGNYGTRSVRPGPWPTVRIDDLHLPQVDFVKIDVEGFEPAVLDGMTQTLARCRPPMTIEVYGGMLRRHGFVRDDILTRLTRLGYEYRGRDGVIPDDENIQCEVSCFPIGR